MTGIYAGQLERGKEGEIRKHSPRCRNGSKQNVKQKNNKEQTRASCHRRPFYHTTIGTRFCNFAKPGDGETRHGGDIQGKNPPGG